MPASGCRSVARERGGVRRAAGAALLLLCSAAVAAEAAPAPERIVSPNVCTDQLVLQHARPERIVPPSFPLPQPQVSPLAARTEKRRGGQAGVWRGRSWG